MQAEQQDQHQKDEAQQSQNIDTNNSSTVTHTQANITYDPQLFTSPAPTLPLAATEAVESSQNFSINLSTAVEMSMQLDKDPNFISNIQMTSAATAEEGVGLTQLEGATAGQQSLRVKDDIPIDLRVKLIVSMIHLGASPTEVSYLAT